MNHPVHHQNPEIQSPSWANNLADLQREHGYEPLHVEGELPASLQGTLFRNGPGRYSMPDGPSQRRPIEHWFDGLGAVSSVRFDQGKAEGAVRLVRPTSLAGEEEDGQRRQWGFGTPPSGWWRRFSRKSRNSANTSVLGINGRLFALYEANMPVELSREDLITIGETSFNGVIPQCFSAHPHRVDALKTTFNFGSRWAMQPMLDVFAIPDGQLPRCITSIPLDGIPLIHDFIATETHIIFIIPPVRLDRIAQLLGKNTPVQNLKWRPALGTEVVAIPIDDPHSVTRFTIDPFWLWHTTNAYNDGEDIVLDFIHYNNFDSMDWLDDILHKRPNKPAHGFPARMRLNLAKKAAKIDVVSDVECEFPKVSAQVEGRRHSTIWAAAHTDATAAASGVQNALCRHDTIRNKSELFTFGDHDFLSEPIPVTKADATHENDVWILSLAYNAKRHASYMGILDGKNPSAGLVAKVWFDQNIPYTFHGQWIK